MLKKHKYWLLITVLFFNFCSNLSKEELWAKKILEEEIVMFEDFIKALGLAKEEIAIKKALQDFQKKLNELSVKFEEFELAYPEYKREKEPPSSLKTEWQRLLIAKAKATKALLTKASFFSDQEIEKTLKEMIFLPEQQDCLPFIF